mmetsp:Transcript_57046/g.165291  ORF Transcript_57046/g.165291 Transcript_57046/m.165291 type:complete len:511 (+) Transcript_57046:54-1586(+)|eukprot:CAMPEP_0170310708 /NCGR_PEP_ID=MMETSP0116_2-20130129/55842_1 /TAXON_ID=400756 /ORGANISM="Durinskia baltica, Strain CSIRO CS-38" /LENGTH=510 /DNA_ID=CAMNT_0010562987 /DNA_START=17 /DNA_END=1549 /DNA_ORIENTATION=-
MYGYTTPTDDSAHHRRESSWRLVAAAAAALLMLCFWASSPALAGSGVHRGLDGRAAVAPRGSGLLQLRGNTSAGISWDPLRAPCGSGLLQPRANTSAGIFWDPLRAPCGSPLLQPRGNTSAGPSKAQRRLEKVSFADVGEDPLATCNDGSPGFFYWAPAARPSRSWIVLLGYGGWCWDAASCALRPPDMTSSTVYADFVDADPGGIAAWTGFNRVFAPQCSSDAWMGDIGANESASGVNWRGARIMRAILRHLTRRRGLADGDTLVFGGLSAGARGAMVHLDTLKSEGLIPQGVKLLGYLDSPYYVEMPAFGNYSDIWHRVTTQTQQMAVSLRNDAILRGNGACTLPEAWQCGFGELRIPLLRTPHLLVASQYDWYGLFTAQAADLNASGSFPEPQCAYTAYAFHFAMVTRHGLQALRSAPHAGVYSSTCYNHAVSLWNPFTAETVGGVSRADALQLALTALDSNNNDMPFIVDTSCAGLGCGSGCVSRVNVSPSGGCHDDHALGVALFK